MAEAKNPLGATGRTVAANVKRLREELRLSYAELERRLESAGRKIPVLGLAGIEKERRRVDADDLTALAAVLEVSPATLLMPVTEHGEDTPAFTGSTATRTAEAIWSWLVAEAPVDLRIEHTETRVSIDAVQSDRFQATARPRWQRWIGAHPAQAAARRAGRWVDQALQPESDDPRRREAIAERLQEPVSELQHMVDVMKVGGDVCAGWQRPEERRGDR